MITDRDTADGSSAPRLTRTCEAYCHGSAGPAIPDHAAVGAVILTPDGREDWRGAKYLGSTVDVAHIRAPGTQQVADLAGILFALDHAPDDGPLTIYTSSGFIATLMEGKLQPSASRVLTHAVRAAVAQRGAQVVHRAETDTRIVLAKELADAELRQRGHLFTRPAGGWLR